MTFEPRAWAPQKQDGRWVGGVTRIDGLHAPHPSVPSGAAQESNNRRTHTRIHGWDIRGMGRVVRDGRIFSLQVADFTHMGMLLRVEEPPAVGDPVELKLNLADPDGAESIVLLHAEVVRHVERDEERLTGIRLTEPATAADVAILDGYYVGAYFVQED